MRQELRYDKDGNPYYLIREESFSVKSDHLSKGTGQTGDGTALVLALRDGVDGYPVKVFSFVDSTKIKWTRCGQEIRYTHDSALQDWIAQSNQPSIRVRLDHNLHRLELAHVFAEIQQSDPVQPDDECVICGEPTYGEGIHEDLCEDCSQV